MISSGSSSNVSDSGSVSNGWVGGGSGGNSNNVTVAAAMGMPVVAAGAMVELAEATSAMEETAATAM